MSQPAPLKRATLPLPPALRYLFGPSFILIGLGLGSGELILWPYLASNWGLGIAWAAVLGVLLQFFMNMEIERYALVRGESVFVGFARKFRFLPLWFILSTLIPWMWPGIITSSGLLLARFLGIGNGKLVAILLLLFVGGILTLGPVLYKIQETLQRTFILVAAPIILALAFWLAKVSDWQALGRGIVGHGDGYWFLPGGIPIASFLAAVAYAGAGGNLNLAQSFYIKDKGYGMGKYAGRITSILTGKKEKLELEGTTFDATPDQVSHFRQWWKLINIEHAVIFWLVGTGVILLLSLLAYSTVFGQAKTGGIDFLFQEASVISARTVPFLGPLFLLLGAIMLFSTQLGVMDTTSRILTENLSLLSQKWFPTVHIRRNFYLFLWLQIALGILILMLGFDEPLALLTLAAVLNAFAMFVHIGLTLWLNLTSLEKPLRPSFVRIGAMVGAFLFMGGFSLFTVINSI